MAPSQRCHIRVTAFQLSSNSAVCPTDCAGWLIKYRSLAYLAFCEGDQQTPLKGPVMWNKCLSHVLVQVNVFWLAQKWNTRKQLIKYQYLFTNSSTQQRIIFDFVKRTVHRTCKIFVSSLFNTQGASGEHTAQWINGCEIKRHELRV